VLPNPPEISPAVVDRARQDEALAANAGGASAVAAVPPGARRGSYAGRAADQPDGVEAQRQAARSLLAGPPRRAAMRRGRRAGGVHAVAAGLHASVATDAGATSHVVAAALGHTSPAVTHAHARKMTQRGHLMLGPVAFLRRWVGSIPPPRRHLGRYAGVFGPRPPTPRRSAAADSRRPSPSTTGGTALVCPWLCCNRAPRRL